VTQVGEGAGLGLAGVEAPQPGQAVHREGGVEHAAEGRDLQVIGPRGAGRAGVERGRAALDPGRGAVGVAGRASRGQDGGQGAHGAAAGPPAHHTAAAELAQLSAGTQGNIVILSACTVIQCSSNGDTCTP